MFSKKGIVEIYFQKEKWIFLWTSIIKLRTFQDFLNVSFWSFSLKQTIKISF